MLPKHVYTVHGPEYCMTYGSKHWYMRKKKSIIEQWASNISRETTAKLAQCDLTKHNTPPIIDI